MPEIQTLGILYTEQGQALPGWHINATAELPALAAYRVEPATPRVLFAGVSTWCYTLPDQAQAEQLLAGLDLSDPPAPPVRAIARRQGKAWLLREGLLGQVEVLVAAGGDELRIWWEDSNEFHLGNAHLQRLFQQLGLPREQLPAAFLAASQL